MKRVRCPKCDGFITFDETKYKRGSHLYLNVHNVANNLVLELEPQNLEIRKKMRY